MGLGARSPSRLLLRVIRRVSSSGPHCPESDDFYSGLFTAGSEPHRRYGPHRLSRLSWFYAEVTLEPFCWTGCLGCSDIWCPAGPSPCVSPSSPATTMYEQINCPGFSPFRRSGPSATTIATLLHLVGFVPQIDLFATGLNTRCKLYMSPCPDSHAVAFDAFIHCCDSWRVLYLFPPIPLISRSLAKLRQSVFEHAFFVCPILAGRPSHSPLLELAYSS